MLDLIKGKFRVVCGYGRNESGFALMATIVVAAVVLIMGLGYYLNNAMEVGAVIRDVERVQNFYAAEAGINWGLVQLDRMSDEDGNITSNWQETVLTTAGTVEMAYVRKDIGGGYYSNREGFLHATTLDPNTGEQDHTLVVEVVIAWNLPMSTATLAGPNGMAGGFIVDGRDHQLAVTDEVTDGWSSVVIPNSGTFGVITDAGTFNRGGNSKIGGTKEDPSVDVDLTKIYAGSNGWNTIVDLNRSNLPTTVDGVMKFAEGYMRQFALDNGTLYTNSHPHTITAADAQIYYYEFDSASDVVFNGLGIEMDNPASTAIFVIHNKGAGDATMKLLSGTFKGVFISDQYDKIHGNIVGGMYSVGGTRSSIGNGNGGAYYCSAVVGQMVDTFGDAWDEGEVLTMQVSFWEEDNSLDVTKGILRDS